MRGSASSEPRPDNIESGGARFTNSPSCSLGFHFYSKTKTDNQRSEKPSPADPCVPIASASEAHMRTVNVRRDVRGDMRAAASDSEAAAETHQRHTDNRETSRPAQTGFFFLALFLDYWLFACIFGSFSSSASQIRLKSCFS